MLEELKAKDPTTRYAYEYNEESGRQGEGCFTENLDRVFI